MAEVSLDNVQGDLFSRGFPKFHEVYYFFSIVPGKEKDFSKALKTLVSEKDKYISSLTKVLADWAEVDAAAEKNRDIEVNAKKEFIPTSNALIAFSKRGLDKIQVGLTGNGLGLNNLQFSDPAFDVGMATDGPKNLNDPHHSTWDPLFNKAPIHGLLKVAGHSSDIVESKLSDIKSVLGHPIIIKDIAGQSPPTSVDSRLDGQVRPWETRMNGFEHFGFRDGISQPLLQGINSDAALERDDYMRTAQKIITVSKKPPGTQDGIKADPKKRPEWMIDGTFLAFRKLEQDVKGWNSLVNKFASAGCGSPDHCGAKLMGRWKSGAPITLFPHQDAPGKSKPINHFDYKKVKNSVCPLGAHIRKVNPRTAAEAVKMARMIRNGIPYGTEFSDRRTTNEVFSLLATKAAWRIVSSQAKGDELLHTTLHDVDESDMNPGLGQFPRMVTMRGGEYFFVPSISALNDVLGSD
ncbi:MAG: hypothetical protein M1831_004463 [Alyxoria varia]|nr:MAG: hypothetical protein M1831_004463 [Alyxoria varia]